MWVIIPKLDSLSLRRSVNLLIIDLDDFDQVDPGLAWLSNVLIVANRTLSL